MLMREIVSGRDEGATVGWIEGAVAAIRYDD
jgi:hypothetical protein